MRPVLRFFSVAILAFTALVAVPTAASALFQEDTSTDSEAVTMVDYEIATMPPVPGVRFTLDGATRTTGIDGTVTFVVPKGTRDEMVTIKDRVVIVDTDVQIDDETRATSSKLVGEVSPLVAGYNLSYPVEFRFTDSNGRIVPFERIDTLIIKSSLGNVETIALQGKTWLLGKRLAGGLEVKEVFWSIQDVEALGASVANRAQTKFYPVTDRQIATPLLFFDTSFTVVDAFLGFPAGDALLIEAPNGSVVRIELVEGRASLTQVPRGEYHVIVEGGGLTIERPVAISRNQDVTLKLYTWFDVLLVLTVLFLFVVAPPAIGLWLRRRHRSDGDEPSAETPEPESLPVPAAVDSSPVETTASFAGEPRQ